MNVKELKGLVVKTIDIGGDSVLIVTECGREFRFFHYQDCCESVWIEDVLGEPKRLEGLELISIDWEEADGTIEEGDFSGSSTLTDITFRTTEETVIVKWVGESNGYYSETVDLEEIGADH